MDAGGADAPDRTDAPNAPDAQDALDALDRRLLGLLQEDARLSHRELARRADTTQPTATARVRRMEDAGIIQGYTVVLDQDAFGGGPDLAAPAAMVCHWCKRRTGEPLWADVGGRRHPFCCATCRTAYRKRHDELAQGL